VLLSNTTKGDSETEDWKRVLVSLENDVFSFGDCEEAEQTKLQCNNIRIYEFKDDQHKFTFEIIANGETFHFAANTREEFRNLLSNLRVAKRKKRG